MPGVIWPAWWVCVGTVSNRQAESPPGSRGSGTETRAGVGFTPTHLRLCRRSWGGGSTLDQACSWHAGMETVEWGRFSQAPGRQWGQGPAVCSVAGGPVQSTQQPCMPPARRRSPSMTRSVRRPLPGPRMRRSCTSSTGWTPPGLVSEGYHSESFPHLQSTPVGP